MTDPIIQNTIKRHTDSDNCCVLWVKGVPTADQLNIERLEKENEDLRHEIARLRALLKKEG
jgi:hypothetical protein